MATAQYAREYRQRPATKRDLERQEYRHKAELQRLEAELRRHQEWPLMTGYKAGKEGRAFDRHASPEWQRGFWLAVGKQR